MSDAATPRKPTFRATMSWRARFALVVFIAVAVAVIWVTNTLLTERFTASTKNRSEVRQALYVGNLLSELRRIEARDAVHLV